MAKRKPAPPPPPKGIRRRVNADGSVVFDPLVWVDVDGKRKQRSLGACDTFDEAVALRHAHFKKMARKGEPVRADPGILTVAQLGALALADAPEWDVDRWRARVLEMAEFATWPATQVTEEHVQVWVHQMATTPIATGRGKGKPPSRPTVYSALSLLRRVYRWGKMPARRYVTHNPAQHVTITNSTEVRLQSQRNALDYLREDEAQKLLEAPREVMPLEAKAKFCTIMVAGPRPIDVWRLRWERFDWRGECIRFTSSKTSRHGGSDYVVHPLPQLWAVLREWWLASGRPTAGLVFPAGVNEDGSERVYARGYDADWQDKRARRKSRRRPELHDGQELRAPLKVTPGWRSKLGIKRDVPLYALRHTAACHLLLGTPSFTGGRMWSREEVQAQLGHKDSAATEHYMLSLGILGRRAAAESKAALRRQRGER